MKGHIVEKCQHILENARPHKTSKHQEQIFLTAYQIYNILEEEKNPLCQELIDECNGDYRGEGAGSYDGQVKRIAQALGRHPEIETQYINTRHLRIKNRVPSSKEDCGIFRIKK